jgi:hypothetical protein
MRNLKGLHMNSDVVTFSVVHTQAEKEEIFPSVSDQAFVATYILMIVVAFMLCLSSFLRKRGE